jgi:HK97 family phage prohead protease
MILNHRTNSREREVRTATIREVRVTTGDDGTHTVSGYAIVYNSQSVDLGGFVETVATGALTRSLTDNPDVLCLRDHKQELLLGRTTSGTLTLTDDATGLRFSCSLPATSAGNDLAESLRRGDIDSCSFGFFTVKDSWLVNDNGDASRTLLDVDLFEISIVSFPAYEATSASIRTAPLEVRSKIEARGTTDKACLCPCPECTAGDCDDCSDPDCEYEMCSCDPDERSRSRKHVELKLRLLERTI